LYYNDKRKDEVQKESEETKMKYGIYKIEMSNITGGTIAKLENHQEAIDLGYTLITTARTKREAEAIYKELDLWKLK